MFDTDSPLEFETYKKKKIAKISLKNNFDCIAKNKNFENKK